MDRLTDKAAYLLGLAEGMKLSEEVPEQKLMLKMLEVLRDFSEYCEKLRRDYDDLAEYVSNIDEDLEEVEAVLFDEEDDDDLDHGDDMLEGEMEYECPHCGYETKFDLADFDFEEDYLCPQCGKSFFPEGEEDMDDDEDDEEDRD